MKWRFEIDNGSEVREVFPKVSNSFAVKWSRKDNRKYDFEKEIDDFSFIKDDFNYLYNLEKNETCYFYYFRVFLICGPLLEEKLIYEGTFSTLSVKWDLDTCLLNVKIKTIDAYTCIEENDDDINIFEGNLTKYTINYDFNVTEFDTIDNGMKLKDVMQYLLDQACPDGNLTIVSDLFQWNPENPSSINYVTNRTNYYYNLIIFQKSDIKRPNASNNATKAESSFKKMLKDIVTMFNCGYKIIDNTFRIEHISWFETDLGLNLIQLRKQKQLRGTKKYSFNNTKISKIEKFDFMDESNNRDFKGEGIQYDNNCVFNPEVSKIEHKVSNITTDIDYVISYGETENKEISDSGFVLVACSNSLNVFSEPVILPSAQKPNNILGWAHLHRDMWRHGRLFYTGTMNRNENTAFFSVIPKIKQDSFECNLDCSEIKQFNPLDKINAMLGWGVVDTAELKIIQCLIKLDLSLERVQQVQINNTLGDFDSNFDSNFD